MQQSWVSILKPDHQRPLPFLRNLICPGLLAVGGDFFYAASIVHSDYRAALIFGGMILFVLGGVHGGSGGNIYIDRVSILKLREHWLAAKNGANEVSEADLKPVLKPEPQQLITKGGINPRNPD